MGLFVVLSESGVRIGTGFVRKMWRRTVSGPLFCRSEQSERDRHEIGFAVFGLYHGVINCGFVCEISLAAMADLVDQRSSLCFELLGVFLLESVVTTTLGV